MKYRYRASKATVTAVLPATEAGTHPNVREVMEMELKDPSGSPSMSKSDGKCHSLKVSVTVTVY